MKTKGNIWDRVDEIKSAAKVLEWHPNLVLGLAAMESGWTTHPPLLEKKNLFGLCDANQNPLTFASYDLANLCLYNMMTKARTGAADAEALRKTWLLGKLVNPESKDFDDRLLDFVRSMSSSVYDKSEGWEGRMDEKIKFKLSVWKLAFTKDNLITSDFKAKDKLENEADVSQLHVPKSVMPYPAHNADEWLLANYFHAEMKDGKFTNGARISDRVGWRSNGVWHPGVDLTVSWEHIKEKNWQVPIYTPFEIEVIKTNSQVQNNSKDPSGFGNYIIGIIELFGKQYRVRMAHLYQDDFIKESATKTRFAAGEQVGHMGNTGTGSGPHLHLDFCDILTWYGSYPDSNNISHFKDPLEVAKLCYDRGYSHIMTDIARESINMKGNVDVIVKGELEEDLFSDLYHRDSSVDIPFFNS